MPEPACDNTMDWILVPDEDREPHYEIHSGDGHKLADVYAGPRDAAIMAAAKELYYACKNAERLLRGDVGPRDSGSRVAKSLRLALAVADKTAPSLESEADDAPDSEQS